MSGEHDSDEEVERLAEAERLADPFLHAQLCRLHRGSWFQGVVEDIEVTKRKRTRLYLCRYKDGDCEHFTADEVRQWMSSRAA